MIGQFSHRAPKKKSNWSSKLIGEIAGINVPDNYLFSSGPIIVRYQLPLIQRRKKGDQPPSIEIGHAVQPITRH